MSRRKSNNVSKRMEYNEASSDEETNQKINHLKRKHINTLNSDNCEWELLNSNPKMMKINRNKTPKEKNSRINKNVVPDDEFEFDDKFDSSKHCANRNALMARRNRIKKKMYVEKLESTIEEMQTKFLKRLNDQDELIKKIQKENKYLRNVITNSSGLKQILQGVRLAAGISNQASQNGHTLNRSSSQTIDSTTSTNISSISKGTDPFLNDYSDLIPDFIHSSSSLIDYLDLPVDVTEIPSSTANTSNDNGKHFNDLIDDDSLVNNLGEESWNNLMSTPIDCHDYSTNPQVGICVHIVNNTLSVEFCESCNENAFHSLFNSDEILGKEDVKIEAC